MSDERVVVRQHNERPLPDEHCASGLTPINDPEARDMTALTRAELARVAPEPWAEKGRVTKAQTDGWTSRELAIRTCCRCKTVYRNAGYAWSCEHWHDGPQP